jgi:hypothetical protein
MRIELDVNLTAAQERALYELLFERQVEGGVQGLLRGLIGDLMHTQDRGGSDECLYAEQWLERRWYPHLPAVQFLDLEYGDGLRKAAKEWAEDMAEVIEEEEWTEEDKLFDLAWVLDMKFQNLPLDPIEEWTKQWLKQRKLAKEER